MSVDDFARILVSFIAIVDPAGNVLAFQAIAGESSRRERLAIAVLAVLVSFVLIAVFAVAGDRVLQTLAVSPYSFQIAAGILLALPALRLVERGEVFDPSNEFGGRRLEAAVVPLALPMLSGPGALALSTTSAQSNGVPITLTAASIALGISFVFFASTTTLVRYVHPAALRAAARIIGVILMALAVEFVVSGWLDATRG